VEHRTTLDQANAERDSGQFESAEQLYQDILRQDPHHGEALLQLGLLKQQIGRTIEAVDWLERAISRDSSNSVARFHLAQSLASLGRPTEAVQQHCAAIRECPDFGPPRTALVALCQQTGQWQVARAAFQQVHEALPNDVEALFFLGIAQRQCGDLVAAAESFRRVIRLAPDVIEAHQNLGATLEANDQRRLALTAYEAALACHGEFAPAHHGRASVLRRMGRLLESLKAYRAAIQLQPDRPDWRCEYAQVLCEAGHADESAVEFTACSQRWPEYEPARLGLSHSLEHAGRLADALTATRDAIAQGHDSLNMHLRLAELLSHAGDWTLAAGVLASAVERWRDSTEAVARLSTAYVRLGQTDRALQLCRAKMLDATRSVDALANLAVVYQQRGEFDRAATRFRALLRKDPNHVLANVNYALILLAKGDFAAGWQRYHWRWEMATSGPRPKERLPVKRWNGESLAGKTILVQAEQGVGDDIMFASCLPELETRADQVIWECDRRLLPLFARSFPRTRMLGTKGSPELTSVVDARDIDVQIAAGCLPEFLRAQRTDFPVRPRYLVADPSKRTTWKHRLDSIGESPKIGISWRGGSQRHERDRRSTVLSDWQPILSHNGAQFVNLQYDATQAEVDDAGTQLGITLHDFPESRPLEDLDNFAALLTALDLVISVTNSTVHLAGALGIETWALVPSVPTWRWMTAGEQMPWYSTVRLFRQQQPWQWRQLMCRVRDELDHIVDRSPSTAIASLTADGTTASRKVPTRTC